MNRSSAGYGQTKHVRMTGGLGQPHTSCPGPSAITAAGGQ